jgi:hypothetical protein
MTIRACQTSAVLRLTVGDYALQSVVSCLRTLEEVDIECGGVSPCVDLSLSMASMKLKRITLRGACCPVRFLVLFQESLRSLSLLSCTFLDVDVGRLRGCKVLTELLISTPLSEGLKNLGQIRSLKILSVRIRGRVNGMQYLQELGLESLNYRNGVCDLRQLGCLTMLKSLVLNSTGFIGVIEFKSPPRIEVLELYYLIKHNTIHQMADPVCSLHEAFRSQDRVVGA